MPVPDPVPSPRPSLRRRFWRIFRLLAALATCIAAIAVVLVARGDTEFHPHMWIATGLGVGLTVLLGGALMSLAFLSSSSGHDEHASIRAHEDGDDIK